MSWTDVDVTLTAEQRVHAGRERDAGNLLRTWRALPGGLLRAALVQAWILEHGVDPQHATGALRQQFVDCYERGLLPGSLLAAGSRVVPASVRRCARPVIDGCASYWYDEARQLLGGAALPDPAAGLPACPHCDGAVSYGKGEVEFAPLAVHPRNADPGPDGQVFTVEVFRRGTVFAGSLALWGEEGARLAQRLTAAPSVVFVGGDLSVYGRCTLTARPAAPPALPAQSATGTVAARVASPVVLVDAQTQPVLTFASAAAAFAVPDPAAASGWRVPTVQRSWARSVLLTGWHLPSGLPKAPDYALEVGSTALLSYGAPLNEDQRDHLAQLRAVGARTNEGYGRVEFLEPARP